MFIRMERCWTRLSAPSTALHLSQTAAHPALTLLIKLQIGSCDTQPDKSRSARQNVRDCERCRNVFIFESKPVRTEKVISKGMIQPLHRREIDGRTRDEKEWARRRRYCTPTLFIYQRSIAL